MGEETLDGFAKVRLVHHSFGSIILVDHVLVDAQEQHYWLQPQYVHAPILDLTAAGGTTLYVDVANTWDLLITLRITFTGDDLVTPLADRSLIYRCRITGPKRMDRYRAGRVRRRDDGGFDLRLYQHTTKAGKKGIRSSGHIRGSAWNYAGTKPLSNCRYAYFTTLREIESEEDLQRVAMSQHGKKLLRLDTNPTQRPDHVLEVHREHTSDRTARLTVWVPAEHVAPSHIWLHHLPNVFYEMTHPWIYRVGLKPEREYPLLGNRGSCPEAHLKRFESIVIGECTTIPGLCAPFEEDATSSTFEIQDLGDKDLFDFWRRHKNKTLFKASNDRPYASESDIEAHHHE